MNMSDTNFSLIDLKALSMPATKLIEAVRSAVGILYEPTRIRQKAKAEADAAIILAKNQAEVREIEVRASERLQDKELRRQTNIESITKKALDSLPSSVSDDPIDQDWIYQFFEHCQDIGNDQMQSIWARLLAGEVAQPGSFSLRTLRIVKDLQKEDADLFTRFCTFVWQTPNAGLMPVIPNIENETIKKLGFYFSQLLHLDSLGLIEFDNHGGYKLQNVTRLVIFYYGRQHIVSVPQGKRDLQLGLALLTSIGKELTPISGSVPSENYRLFVVETWRNSGFAIED